MDFKELIKFGLEESSEPIIKNPVLRDAMAEGGRMGFGDGGITLIKNKSKNVVGEKLRLFNQGKLYHLRLGKDKINHYGSKAELTKIFKKRKTAGGAQVAKRTIPQGLVTGEKMLEAAKKKNIFVGKARDPNNFANVFDFPKTTVKGKNFYDISKLNNEKAVDTILEAQVRSGSATDYAKKKFPVKSTYDHTKKRYLAEKAAGGVKDSGWAAKRGSGVQLGHADDFWMGRKITPQNLLYTPTEINKLLGDKGMLDDKINAVYEKQEYGKLTKKGDELKKFLNETDATLTRLADQSDGFKQVTLSNNKPYGGGKFSVDMFDEFKGMSQKETVDFVNKWKDKKTWNTAEEFNNIKKAKLFEVNRKEAYKAAGKMSRKEKSKVMYKVKEDFRKQLLRLGGCGMYAGGRVGFKAGSGCIKRAMAKLKSGKLNASEKKIVDAMGDGLKKIGGKGGMPKNFWTTAIKGEGYFALADFANNLTKGQSLDKSFSNAIKTATFGLADFKGNERDLLKYAEERGLDTEAVKQWMDYGKTYGKYEKAHEDLKWAEKIKESGGEFSPNHILNPEPYTGAIDASDQAKSAIDKYDKQLTEKEEQESIYSGKGSKDFNEAIEGVVAKEWNKYAGTPLDRGFRKMVGMKGDEGLLWGILGNLTREGIEKLGLGEHDALKGFKPQIEMNYHPVYGYKEDIKKVMRDGDSPMEDMLEFMKKHYPNSGLLEEVMRGEENLQESEGYDQTGWGLMKRPQQVDMGTYDYDPNLGYNYAGGGIAGIRRPSAIPPESGPTPYGLPSMLNHVKKV